MNNELSILLLLARSTIKDKKDGLITSDEADKVFFEIKQKLADIDKELSKSFLEKLVSRLEF